MTYQNVPAYVQAVTVSGYPSTQWGTAVNDSQNELWNIADDWEDVTTGYTLTNLTIGNGTVAVVRYRFGAVVNVVGKITFGSTTSVTGNVDIRDMTADPLFTSGRTEGAARCVYWDNSGADYHLGAARAYCVSGVDYVELYAANGGRVNATTPFTWATSDVLMWATTEQNDNETTTIR